MDIPGANLRRRFPDLKINEGIESWQRLRGQWVCSEMQKDIFFWELDFDEKMSTHFFSKIFVNNI